MKEDLGTAVYRESLLRVRDILVEKAIHEDDCPFVMGDENGDGHVACECYLDAVFEAIGYPDIDAMDGEQEQAKHHGQLDSFPPYVGGDDDEIDEWQAMCRCGWRGRKTEHVTVAYGELAEHLNASLSPAKAEKEPYDSFAASQGANFDAPFEGEEKHGE